LGRNHFAVTLFKRESRNRKSDPALDPLRSARWDSAVEMKNDTEETGQKGFAAKVGEADE
jgi:hypothetical protein